MPPVIIADANVLYSRALRDFFIRLALAGTLELRWSEAILDETFRSLHASRPDLSHTALTRTRQLMNTALPASGVVGFEHLVAGIELPDANDRHVVAAALHARATHIVTANLRDFPASYLASMAIEVEHPDGFLTRMFQSHPETTLMIVARIVRDSGHPPMAEVDVAQSLGAASCPSARDELIALLGCG